MLFNTGKKALISWGCLGCGSIEEGTDLDLLLKERSADRIIRILVVPQKKEIKSAAAMS